MPDVIQIKSAEQIQDDFLNALAALLKINDRNMGADIRTLAYAYGLELDELYYQLLQGLKARILRSSTGFQLEQIAADENLQRKGAKNALVSMTLFGVNGTVVNIGDTVSKPATSTREEVLYESLEQGTVSSGQVILTFRALTPGEIGNAGIGEINSQGAGIAGITSVSNNSFARGGRDQESDDELRQRILNHRDERIRGTLPAIRGGILNFEQQSVTLAESITASSNRLYIFEDFQEYTFAESGKLLIGDEIVEYSGYSATPDENTNNAFPYFFGVTRGVDSTTAVSHDIETEIKENIAESAQKKIEFVSLVSTLCQIDAYVAFSTLETPHPTLLEVLRKRIEGDNSEYNPGYRSAGSAFNLFAATIQPISVAVNIEVDEDFVSEASSVAARVKDEVLRFINNTEIGEGVIGWGVAAALDILGVKRLISLTINGNVYDGSDGADVVINSTSVARTSASNVAVTT